MKIKKLGKINKVIIIEVIAIIIMIIALVSGIKVFNLSKEKVYKQPIEENLTEIESETNSIYIVDITEAEENIIENANKNNEVNEQNKKNDAKYYIKVNYGAQVVTIYSKDSEGNYTVPVKAMVCSTGTASPKSGVYAIPGRWVWGLMQGNVYGQYVTKITGNILFHSVPYTKQNPSTLEYWEYDKLGTAASLGCVRLRVEDAKWIYNNCENGTNVEFYSSSEPGPLGKPTAKKISNYPDYLRNWDPTDPNPSNPWHNYNENNEQNEVKNETEGKENKVENGTVDKGKNEVENKTTDKGKNEVENETTDKGKNEIENKTTDKSKNEVENKTIDKEKNEAENKTINKENEVKNNTKS